MASITRLVGKIKRGRSKTEVILIFRVGRKYYPNTPDNAQNFEAYLHTGDEFYLAGLTDELEV